MSDLVPQVWWEQLEREGQPFAHEATFRLASALAQDGVTRVTVVLPRAPGVLVRARAAAQTAGVSVWAGPIRSRSMTIRFSAQAGKKHGSPSPERSRLARTLQPVRRYWHTLRERMQTLAAGRSSSGLP